MAMASPFGLARRALPPGNPGRLHRNRAAERFALRLQQETECVLADREHSRIVNVAQFAEREPTAGAAG
jgi:hypothetical protein